MNVVNSYAREGGSAVDPLSALLDLSAAEKSERGLLYTPREIAQQPATWIATFDRLRAREKELSSFLSATGVSGPAAERPTVFLIGAGTSDYIGWCLHHLLRAKWQCEVIPVASTSLLTNFPEYLLKEKRYLWVRSPAPAIAPKESRCSSARWPSATGSHTSW